MVLMGKLIGQGLSLNNQVAGPVLNCTCTDLASVHVQYYGCQHWTIFIVQHIVCATVNPFMSAAIKVCFSDNQPHS